MVWSMTFQLRTSKRYFFPIPAIPFISWTRGSGILKRANIQGSNMGRKTAAQSKSNLSRYFASLFLFFTGVASFTQIRMRVLEKLIRFFLKVFWVSTWLDFVHVLCRFFPVCLSVIQHRLLIHVNTTVWVVECNKFETFLNKFCLQAIPQYTAYSWKSETENRPWVTNHSF